MTAHVFTYGTLLLAEVMEAVTGERFASVPARLDGHERVCVRDAVYPGARAAPGASIDGILWLDVGEDALVRLDRFEGEMYERRAVSVATAGGARAAQVYVVGAAHEDLLVATPWDLDEFRRRHLETYLARCRAGFVAADYDG